MIEDVGTTNIQRLLMWKQLCIHSQPHVGSFLSSFLSEENGKLSKSKPHKNVASDCVHHQIESKVARLLW